MNCLVCCVCRRVDAAAANRANLTREELELIDVSNEMEQQLLQQYTQVGCQPPLNPCFSALQQCEPLGLFSRASSAPHAPVCLLHQPSSTTEALS